MEPPQFRVLFPHSTHKYGAVHCSATRTQWNRPSKRTFNSRTRVTFTLVLLLVQQNDSPILSWRSRSNSEETKSRSCTHPFSKRSVCMQPSSFPESLPSFEHGHGNLCAANILTSYRMPLRTTTLLCGSGVAQVFLACERTLKTILWRRGLPNRIRPGGLSEAQPFSETSAAIPPPLPF